MVKKCLLILLVLLCMSACTSKEEKQELDREKQQGTANALLYMKDKYGITANCKRNPSGIWRCITNSQAQTEAGWYSMG